MVQDSRLSGVLHVLLHMAEADAPLTSETLAKAMQTNPVVVRRVMGGLRDAGLVRSEKGYGGGWSLTRGLHAVTLREVYQALGAPRLFASGNRSGAPSCLVEQAVNASLDDALQEAEALLLARMGSVSLASIADDFRRRRETAGKETIHAV